MCVCECVCVKGKNSELRKIREKKIGGACVGGGAGKY